MKKRLFSTALALLLCLGLLPMTALAVDVRSVRISGGDITLRVDASKQLKATVTPSDADDDSVYWESDDDDVAEVDGDGRVTAVDEGTAKITAYSYDNPKKKASITVTVTTSSRVVADSLAEQRALDSANSTSISSNSSSVSWLDGVKESNAATTTTSSSTTSSSATTTVSTGEITSTEMQTQITQALSQTPAGGTADVIFRKRSSVSANALQTAAVAAKTVGKSAVLKFTTAGAGGSTQGQLNVSAASAAKITSSVGTGIYTDDASVADVRNMFTRQFGKTVAVIYCTQPGSFGMTVDIYAKMDLSGMNTSDLTFHYYDKAANQYASMGEVSYQTGENGFLHLTAQTGGYIIVSQK